MIDLVGLLYHLKQDVAVQWNCVCAYSIETKFLRFYILITTTLILMQVIQFVTMGACISAQKLSDNTFRVVNINDDKRLVRKGTIEVSASDLIYTDSKTNETWQWPLKHLRKYGCDGSVFSFEAGRKCPGGEGLYAFSTERASGLFNMVAFNINQGNLLSPGVQEAETEATQLDGPASLSPNDSAVQPNYQNVDLNGLHIMGPDVGACAGSDVPAPVSDRPPSVSESGPKKFTYREVVFERPPQDHPAPSPDPTARTSYTQIDFQQTQDMNRQQRFAAGTSLSFSHAPRPHHILSQKLSPPHPQPSYANVTPGPNIAQQPSYGNITCGPSVASTLPPITQQPSYGNITCGPSVASPLPLMSNGETINYADISIQGSTSTPGEPVQPAYMQLHFQSPGPADSSVPEPQASGESSPEATATPQPKAADEGNVNYQELNFKAMAVLSEMNVQRKQELAEKQELAAEKQEKKKTLSKGRGRE